MADGLRVLILSASAGNGHTRAAQAMEAACRANPDIAEVQHWDALAFTNKLFQDLYAKLYIEAVKKAPLLWAWAFDETDVPWRKARARIRFQRLNSQPLVKKIVDYHPDVTLCTHFMPADIVANLIRHDRLDTHLSVTVTDFYVHATWLTDLFSRYFVAKDECKAQLAALGFPEERITVSGIPIDPVFAERPDRAEMCRKHGLDPALPVIILSAGAFGVTPPEDIQRMLHTITTPCQIVIICGRNQKLKRKIEQAVSENQRDHLTYHILGFTTEMNELMAAADLLIGKPGGLTSSECLACRLPMVIWQPIPGQELFNSAYLLENGAAIAPNAANTLGYKVDTLLRDPERMQRMREAAVQISHPNAAADIARILVEKSDEPIVKVRRK
ncbi:MAG: glycosyltransferase [Spartobacteria bacterium]|nr:glycosyltransferase [Spartobacteria bacterium]